MASNDLTWMLIRNQNSFLVKRPNLHRSFSREANNVRSIHTPTSSGLAQCRTIAVKPTTTNAAGVELTIERQRVSQLKVSDRFVTTSLLVRKGLRHAAGAAYVQIESYRPDLLKGGLAKVSKLIKAQRAVKENKVKRRHGIRAAKKAKAQA